MGWRTTLDFNFEPPDTHHTHIHMWGEEEEEEDEEGEETTQTPAQPCKYE